MESLEKLKKKYGLNDEVKENKVIKFFNSIFILLSLCLSFLIYCKHDENGYVLKKLFNVDVSFVKMNQSISQFIDNIFKYKDESVKVTSLDLYHHVGFNNYISDDKTIRSLQGGSVITLSFQNDYKYFVVIEYDNEITALYTYIDEVNISIGDKLIPNQVIGTYSGDYFNCIFKSGENIISYADAIK